MYQNLNKLKSDTDMLQTIEMWNTSTDETWIYTIELTTGHEKGAGTTANVFIIFNGENDAQVDGRVNLNNSELENDTTDIFHIQATSNQTPLDCLLIGHDGSGESPDWFCKEITVRCHRTGLLFIFIHFFFNLKLFLSNWSLIIKISKMSIW